jgi:hypothetical protein
VEKDGGKKYCRRGNIFCYDKSHAPIILERGAVKIGYMWNVDNGDNGTFWELYCICNEETKIV